MTVSRIQGKFPNPWMCLGCWAFTVSMTNIRCISIGNKYQSHWLSASLNACHWPAILSPSSQSNVWSINDHSRNETTLAIAMKLRPLVDLNEKRLKLKFRLLKHSKANQRSTNEYSTSSNLSSHKASQATTNDHMNWAVIFSSTNSPYPVAILSKNW